MRLNVICHRKMMISGGRNVGEVLDRIRHRNGLEASWSF
jgi:hypothetical protein